MKCKLFAIFLLILITGRVNSQIIILQPLLCSGDSNAVLLADTTGWGTGPYTYAWNTGDAGQMISNLPAGYYSVTITDNSLPPNVVISNVNLVDPGLVVQPLIVHNQCNGDTSGQISLQISGGIPPYNFLWNGPGGYTAITEPIVSLASGIYYYFITDGNGCTVAGQVEIEPQQALQGYIVKTDIQCGSDSSGSAQAAFFGGSGYLSYAWSTGDTTAAIYDLVTGPYTLTVTDGNGCQYIDSVNITGSTGLLITLDTLLNVVCGGSPDGAILLTTTGGSGPISYVWTYNGDVYPETSEDIINLYAGTYILVATDSMGCSITSSYFINQPFPTTFIDSVKQLSCNNGADGYWSIQPFGSDGPYVAVFSTNDTMSSDTAAVLFINGLAAGTYTCVITGTSGCQYNFILNLQQPLPIAVGISSIMPVTCNGGTDGSITLDQVQGGAPPYTYLWSSGDTSGSIAGVPAGVYSVTITDSLLCNVVVAFEITEPYENIKFFATVQNTSCFEAEDGQIVLYPENVFWSPFNNYLIIYDTSGVFLDSLSLGEAIVDLAPGPYIGSLINSAGCAIIDTIIVEKGPDHCILIPNLVTPNGDLKNDVFRVEGGCDYDVFFVTLYNDMGDRVFESEVCDFTWDPLSANVLSGTVYYYYVKVTELDDMDPAIEKTYEFKGSVNINY
jgi:hypothetical protein